MKFYAACLVWLIVAGVLGFGLWKVSHGASVWFLVVPVVAVLVLMARTGYRVD